MQPLPPTEEEKLAGSSPLWFVGEKLGLDDIDVGEAIEIPEEDRN